jgi:hypothetical protein
MLLDQITALRYGGKLPGTITGDLQYPLICAFQAAKINLSEVMGKWHSSLKYSSADSLLDSNAAGYIWDGDLELPNVQRKTKNLDNSTAVTPAKTKKLAAPNKTQSLHKPLPAVKVSIQDIAKADSKRVKCAMMDVTMAPDNSPVGMQWNPVNYSCAYEHGLQY